MLNNPNAEYNKSLKRTPAPPVAKVSGVAGAG